MGVFTGPNSPSPGTDFEAKSDRMGLPNRSSNPSPASAGDMYFNTSDNKAKFYNGSEWVALGSTPGATGGTIINVTGYKIHVFTEPGVFIAEGIPSCDVLVVGGGGGGGIVGNRNGGGGGAGGFRLLSNFTVSDGSYEVVVGQGARAPVYNWGSAGACGSDSIFSTITATGGGGGAGGTNYPDNGSDGTPGGSGGGAQRSGYAGEGNSPPTSPPQGNDGASGGVAGGGGGAGGAAPGTAGGVGAPVTWLPTSYGTPGPQPGRYFAGGGGIGGGGAGGGGSPGGGNSKDGDVNTGGGGSDGGGSNQVGGAGGPGIVAIRYSV